MADKMFSPEFWASQWAVVAAAPFLVVPIVIVVAIVVWFIRGFKNDREIAGLKAENKALGAQKEAAVEGATALEKKLSNIEGKLSELGHRVSGLERPDVKKLVADVTTATSEAATANTKFRKQLQLHWDQQTGRLRPVPIPPHILNAILRSPKKPKSD